MTPSTVLILGANGRFGQAATQAFAAAGWRVLAQARHAPARLPSGAQFVSTRLDDTEALAVAAAGARVVVYAVNPPYTAWSKQLLPLARQGFAVAERLNALFMLPGNVYNFGEQMPALLREDSPQRPTTQKGRQRVALEAEMAARPALRSVVIRAGDFFGAGTGSWLDLVIVKSLRAGKLVYPGPLDVLHPWAYLPDLARAFVAVASRDDGQARHRCLHFAGHAVTGHDLLAAIEAAAQELGIAARGGWRRGGMPWGLLRVGGLVVPMWREVAAMAYLWRVAHQLDGSALAAAIGRQHTTPLVDALIASLRQLHLGDVVPRSAAI